eukprot:5238037-Amphidinium_carterae.1
MRVNTANVEYDVQHITPQLRALQMTQGVKEAYARVQACAAVHTQQVRLHCKAALGTPPDHACMLLRRFLLRSPRHYVHGEVNWNRLWKHLDVLLPGFMPGARTSNLEGAPLM